MGGRFGIVFFCAAIMSIAIGFLAVQTNGETSFSSIGRESDTLDGFIHHEIFKETFSGSSDELYGPWRAPSYPELPTKNSNSITFDTTDEDICYLISREIKYLDEKVHSELPILEIKIKFRILANGKDFCLYNDEHAAIFYGENGDKKIYNVYLNEEEEEVKNELFTNIQQDRWYILTIIFKENTFKVILFDTQIASSWSATGLHYYSDDLGTSQFYLGDKDTTAYGNCEFFYFYIYGLPIEPFFEDFNDINMNNWRYCQFDDGSIIRVKNQALYIKSSDVSNNHCAYVESPRIDIDFEQD